MKEEAKSQETSISIPVPSRSILFLGITLALLLSLIGSLTGVANITIVGTFIFSFVLFWGGLFSPNEGNVTRAIFLIIGGLAALEAFGGIYSFTQLIR